MDAFIGTIIIFGGNFAPRDWAFCNGQLLQIQQYSALYSLIGDTYGGDGRTTFALPDLRGRVPMGYGQGKGLGSIPLGLEIGHEVNTPTIVGMASESNEGGLPVVSKNATDNHQPSLGVNYIICLNGLYPSRS